MQGPSGQPATPGCRLLVRARLRGARRAPYARLPLYLPSGERSRRCSAAPRRPRCLSTSLPDALRRRPEVWSAQKECRVSPCTRVRFTVRTPPPPRSASPRHVIGERLLCEGSTGVLALENRPEPASQPARNSAGAGSAAEPAAAGGTPAKKAVSQPAGEPATLSHRPPTASRRAASPRASVRPCPRVGAPLRRACGRPAACGRRRHAVVPSCLFQAGSRRLEAPGAPTRYRPTQRKATESGTVCIFTHND